MPENKTCPLCAVSGKDSDMKPVPNTLHGYDNVYCCVSCYVLMDGDEVEHRWLELMANYKKLGKLKALINKFSAK